MKRTITAVLLVLLTVALSGCANYDFGETGQYIVSAKEALSLAESGAIIVDAQAAADYAAQHIEGAVSIPMGSLVVNEPYENMLPDAGQIETVMGSAGITENDTLLVYDNNANMQAARIQWTLNMFNNFNVKVISGGLEALKEAGAKATSDATVLPQATYTCGERQKTLIVNMDYVKLTIDKAEEGTLIIDTRSDEEFNAGTIPGSVHINYILNNYPSGEYKSVMDMQSTYLNYDILPDMKLIVFCKTSVRAAQTYTALKNAGYKDVRIYDGAWLEYSANNDSTQSPTQTIAPSKQDAS